MGPSDGAGAGARTTFTACQVTEALSLSGTRACALRSAMVRCVLPVDRVNREASCVSLSSPHAQRRTQVTRNTRSRAFAALVRLPHERASGENRLSCMSNAGLASLSESQQGQLPYASRPRRRQRTSALSAQLWRRPPYVMHVVRRGAQQTGQEP